MKQFICKVIFFLLLPVLMIFIFDNWLRQHNSLYREKYQGLIKAKDNVEIIILGNSHATYGVDPSAFKDHYAFNLANVSQTIFFDKRLLLRALREGFPELEYVLISLDFHSLNKSSQGELRNIWSYYGNGIKHPANDYLLADISPFLWGYTPKVSLSLLKKALLRYWRYGNRKVLDFDVETGVDITETLKRGFITFSTTNEKSFSEDDYISRAGRFKRDFSLSTERSAILADLDDLISLLLKKGLKPILFSTPTFTEYNKFLDEEIISRNMQDIRKLLQKHNIEFWDYSDDKSFKKEDFFNCDHLNKQGAAKFAKILSARLKGY